MKFKVHPREEPEINLIAFIDVLLVVLIFLMMSTSFSKFKELKINLPTAQAQAGKPKPKEIVVLVSADGRYMVNQQWVDGRSVTLLSMALSSSAGAYKDSIVVINADASATHQSVINVMDAARRVGLGQLTFATQGTSAGTETDAAESP